MLNETHHNDAASHDDTPAGPSFAELRRLVAEMPIRPAPDGRAVEALRRWISGAQGRDPAIRRPRLALFAASHGHVPATLRGAASEAIASMVEGRAVVNRLCEAFDVELRAYELAVEEPTGDIGAGPAMTPVDAAHAAAFGMMAVEQGVDLLVLGAIGPGGGQAAEAVTALLGLAEARDPVARAALVQHRALAADPLAVLAAAGGRGIAAALGALIAAGYGGCPVVLDGPEAIAAAALLRSLREGADGHARADLGAEADQGLAGLFAVPLLRGAALIPPGS